MTVQTISMAEALFSGKRIGMLTLTNSIRMSPFASAHSTDPYAFANYAMDNGATVSQIIDASNMWHMDNWRNKYFFRGDIADLEQNFDALAICSSLPLQGFCENGIPAYFRNVMDILYATDMPIYILIQDPRPEFMVHWHTTLAGQEYRFRWMCPGTKRPAWAGDLPNSKEWHSMGLPYAKYLGMHLPSLWQQGKRRTEFKGVDIVFPGVRFSEKRKYEINSYLSSDRIVVRGIGPTEPFMQSITGNKYVSDYSKVCQHISKSAASLFLLTEWHKECDEWYTTRFWQALLLGTHLLIPYDYKLLESLPKNLKTYAAVFEAAEVADKVNKFRRDVSYRNKVLKEQWNFFCEQMGWPKTV